MRNFSADAVPNLNLSFECSYWIYPAYSPVPEVASEKNILPSLEVPLLIVNPVLPVVAIVNSSAPVAPSVAVPINNLPSEISIFPPLKNLLWYAPLSLS